MKIEFEVPDWAYGKRIYIFAGHELLGDKRTIVSHKDRKHVVGYQPLRIKPADGRCTGCGTCCKGCTFITPSGCLLGSKIPHSCARSLCTGFDGCTERLEVVE